MGYVILESFGNVCFGIMSPFSPDVGDGLGWWLFFAWKWDLRNSVALAKVYDDALAIKPGWYCDDIFASS